MMWTEHFEVRIGLESTLAAGLAHPAYMNGQQNKVANVRVTMELPASIRVDDQQTGQAIAISDGTGNMEDFGHRGKAGFRFQVKNNELMTSERWACTGLVNATIQDLAHA